MAGDHRVDTLALPETLRLVHELLDRLLGRLRDAGPALPEAERPMPDTDSEGGRGLAIARVALDDLDHQRVDGHNEWTMCAAGADLLPIGRRRSGEPPGILLR